ncbi:hypothetical protein [Nonomuraea sp. NPDC005650]|uniref:hypothetical protein n=1 Tax=Nonomuraea sp. NPDC005650 TaxID=3157045 RepID=UPI0033A6AAEF
MTTVEELRNKYGTTWEICTELAYGAAAWRRTYLAPAALGRHRVNVMCAGGLDGLAERLATQEATQ